MSNSHRRTQAAEGYVLPNMAAKELLARNAREDSELKSRRKQLDKERKKLESDFSRARWKLLYCAHTFLQDGDGVEPSEARSSSGEDVFVADSEGGHNPATASLALETASIQNPGRKQSLLQHDGDDQNSGDAKSDFSSSNDSSPGRKTSWVGKVDSCDLQNEFASSRPQPRRKISCGGRLDKCDTINELVASNALPRSKISLSWDGLDSCSLKSEVPSSISSPRRKISCAGRVNTWDPNREIGLRSKSPPGLARKVGCVGRTDKCEIKNEFASSNSLQAGRKVSCGGRMDNCDTRSENVKVSNLVPRHKKSLSWEGPDWDATSVISQTRSERNASSERHAVFRRSQSFNQNNTQFGLTKAALQKHCSSTSMQRARKHATHSRGGVAPDLKSTTRDKDEKCPVLKPLADILPPIILPPVYLQGKTTNKQINNKAKCAATHGTTQENGLDTSSKDDDLVYCRYLRIKQTNSDECI